MPKNLQFSLTDLQTPEGLERLLRQIVIPDPTEGGAELPNDQVLAARLAPYIRNQLQATGKAPLNLTALPGGSGSITGDGNATHFLDGTLAFDTVKDTDLSVSDNTTNDASTTAHGFAPKGSGNATDYLDGTLNWSVPGGSSGGGAGNVSNLRLTLATGYPYYAPQDLTPSSTDTGAETVTFAAAHGYVTGTRCMVSATGGGLTVATLYYLRAVSSTAVSFHTTVADAESGGSPVNLTASITAVVMPSGVESTTLLLTPGDEGNGIDVYDSGWTRMSTAEVSKALGTLTANTNYDVFTYLDTGAVVMELVAWTSDLVRATALARDSGRWVKTGSTNLYVGTIRTNSTTTTIDDYGGLITQVGGKRWVWNAYNRQENQMFVFEGTSSWTYSTETWRPFNNATGNSVSAVNGLPIEFTAEASAMLQGSGGSQVGSCAVGVDSTTAPYNGFRATVGASNTFFQAIGRSTGRLAPGFHTFTALEISNGTATLTWYGAGTTPTALTGRFKSGIQACVQG